MSTPDLIFLGRAAPPLSLALTLGLLVACGASSDGSKDEGGGDAEDTGDAGETDDAGEAGGAEPGDEPPPAGDDAGGCDAGDQAWVERTLPFLLGRKPESSREVDLLVSMIEQLDEIHGAGEGRRMVARGLAQGDRYIQRWETFFLEQTFVNRIETKANIPCYRNGTTLGDDATLAAFIRDNEALGSNIDGQPTMRDVLRSSLRLDDITPYYRADLFARMARPLDGANVTAEDLDLMRRMNYGEIFENSYLGRTTLCLQCHNSDTAVTYSPDPGLNRHWPITGHFEKAIWGDHEGRPEDELFAVFRWNGFADDGSSRPWGLSAGCGTFATHRGGDLWQTPAYLAGPLPAGAQLYDLDPRLKSGFDQLYDIGLELDGNDDLLDPNVALAYLTAANISNSLWKAALGAGLVLSNRFPRNATQREVLQDLTEVFIASGYSPRELLVEITSHPYYNQAAPDLCQTRAPYPLDPVFEPFSPAASDPSAQGNSVGDAVHRHGAWVLLDAAAQTMWWPQARRWGEQTFNGVTPPPRADFLASQGVFMKDSQPGGSGVDFFGLLSWERELARGEDPGLGGACTGPLSGGCAPEDWPASLAASASAAGDATVLDVALAIKDRVHAEPWIDPYEVPHVAALMGASLDTEVSELSAAALEAGIRRYAGLLLNTPQYMLANVASRGRRSPVRLIVPGTATAQLCGALGPQILDGIGQDFSCDGSGITLVP